MANNNKLTSIFQGLIITIIVVFVLDITQTVILPFVFAVFLSFILEPLVNLLMKLKLNRIFAVTITILITFSILFLVGVLIYTSAKDSTNVEEAFFMLFEKVIGNTLEKKEDQDSTTTHISYAE
jgi:predicted PurR-regulated permease PerM